MMKKTNLQRVKKNNKALILECLKKGKMSRSKIVELTGLSKAAVTLLTNEFIESGEIIESGTDFSGSVGRPQTTLQLVKNCRYAIGITLHRVNLAISIVDLFFNPIYSQSFATNQFSSPKQAIDFLYSALEKAIADLGISNDKLLGLGISSPGPLDYEKGIILNPPNFELFHHFEIKKYLSTKTSLPVFLDNNAVLLAMREAAMVELPYKNTMFVTVADGIGSAILTGGEIYRGHSGHSGEIGHISIDPNGPLCPCGNTGCLEGYISLSAIKKSFNIENYKEATCKEADVQIKNDVINYICNQISGVLITATNLFDLDSIIIFGELNDEEGLLTRRINEIINKRSIISAAHNIKVIPSQQSSEASTLCSAAAIIKAYFEQRL